jgi:hypothetical protein
LLLPSEQSRQRAFRFHLRNRRHAPHSRAAPQDTLFFAVKRTPRAEKASLLAMSTREVLATGFVKLTVECTVWSVSSTHGMLSKRARKLLSQDRMVYQKTLLHIQTMVSAASVVRSHPASGYGTLAITTISAPEFSSQTNLLVLGCRLSRPSCSFTFPHLVSGVIQNLFDVGKAVGFGLWDAIGLGCWAPVGLSEVLSSFCGIGEVTLLQVQGRKAWMNSRRVLGWT